MDDEITAASHVAHRELYETVTRLEGKPAAPPSADDWDAVSTMPYPHQTTARLHLQAQELAMQRRADGTTPLPHGPGLSPDEARDARRQVLRDRLAYEQAEAKRQPEVQIDLMATA